MALCDTLRRSKNILNLDIYCNSRNIIIIIIIIITIFFFIVISLSPSFIHLLRLPHSQHHHLYSIIISIFSVITPILIFFGITTHITPHHITLYHITAHRITAHRITSHHITSHHTASPAEHLSQYAPA